MRDADTNGHQTVPQGSSNMKLVVLGATGGWKSFGSRQNAVIR